MRLRIATKRCGSQLSTFAVTARDEVHAMKSIEEQIGKLTRNRRQVKRYIQALELLTGLILLFIGWHMGKRPMHLLRTGTRTQGRIVAYQERRFQDSRSTAMSSTGFMPIVEFRTNDQVVRFEDWLGSSSQSGMNTEVRVLYDRSEPSLAMIDRPVWNWLPWFPTLAVGVLLVIDGCRGLLRPLD